MMEPQSISTSETVERFEPLSSTPTAQPLPPLLALPLELRYLIFKNLLWTQHLIIISDNPIYKRKQGLLAGLQSTTHQLEDEIDAWLWSDACTDGLLSRDLQKFPDDPSQILDYHLDMPSLGAWNRYATTVILEENPGDVEVMAPPLDNSNWVDIYLHHSRRDPKKHYLLGIPNKNPNIAKRVYFTEELKKPLMAVRRENFRILHQGRGEIDRYLEYDESGEIPRLKTMSF
jgi:hypothetical protein